MIKVGDHVKTDFHSSKSDIVLHVISVKKPLWGNCESGFMVTARDEKGNKLTADMNWFKVV